MMFSDIYKVDMENIRRGRLFENATSLPDTFNPSLGAVFSFFLKQLSFL
jgi:hypothetical protein